MFHLLHRYQDAYCAEDSGKNGCSPVHLFLSVHLLGKCTVGQGWSFTPFRLSGGLRGKFDAVRLELEMRTSGARGDGFSKREGICRFRFFLRSIPGAKPMEPLSGGGREWPMSESGRMGGKTVFLTTRRSGEREQPGGSQWVRAVTRSPGPSLKGFDRRLGGRFVARP